MGKVVAIPDRRTIEAEACAWIAQLDGEQPSPEDLAAFREWMGRSPMHRAEIERLSALWSDLNILTDLAVPLETAASPRRNFWRGMVDFRLPQSPGVRAIALAAMITVVVISFFLFQPPPVAEKGATLAYATAVGEQKPITLPDGSTILLNTDSQVEVSYNNQRRKIRLLQGEAYFKVAHNRDRPFLVYAGAGVVRAVGTAFSVHLKSHDIEVMVTEGSVELASLPDTLGESSTYDREEEAPATTKLAMVQANQTARFSQNIESIQSIASEEVNRKLSWQKGMLIFSGEPLQQVVEEVSRYTDIKIVIADPALRTLRVGGYFKVGELEAMFEALEKGFHVHIERVDENLVRLSSEQS